MALRVARSLAISRENQKGPYTAMSLIDKDRISYLSEVEQFFLALTDSGLALSANDYHLISQWEDRQVPVHLVCRGIEKGFVEFSRQSRRPAGRKLCLGQLKDSVEHEIERSRRP